MIAFLVFVFPLFFYLSLPSSFWNFDGVACAAALELGQMSYLFHSNHLLYGFLGYLFWKGIGLRLGLSHSLPALQLFTSLLACLGLIGVYRILHSLIKNSLSSFLLTSSLAFTAAFWVWSIEAQVYTLGFLALAWAAYFLLYPPKQHFPVIVGIFHGLAVLGHVMHVLWVIPALYWIGHDRKAIRQYLATLSVVTIVPYLFVLGFVIAPGREWGRIWIWMKGSAGLSPNRSWAWHAAGWRGPWVWLKSTAPSLWGSFWPYETTVIKPWLWVLTALSAAVFLLLLERGWPHRKEKMARFAWLWLGVYGLFLSTWEAGTLCYRLTDILPLGILLGLGLKTYRPRAQALLAALFLGSTLTVNLYSRILPMHRSELNRPYQETLSLSKITPPNTLYITNGGLSWIYLLYFTGRTAWNAHAFKPQDLEQAVAREKRRRPVYVEQETSWQQVH